MKHPLVPVALILAFLILLAEGLTGCFTRWTNPMRSPTHYSHFISNECFMRVRVTDLPQHRPHSYRTLCQVLEVSDSTNNIHPCHGKILLYLTSSFDVGDELLILASPELPSTADNPHQFDYRKHLLRRGICYTDFIPDSHCRLINHSTSGISYHISQFRKRLINVIHFSQLTPSQQGIAEALILGWNGDLDKETQAHFRTAGVVHLLCVSGLHVGIVAMLVGWLLSFLGNKKRMRLLNGSLQLAAVWAFALLTGPAPAATRAAIMVSFMIVGKIISRQTTTLNTVAASAVFMLAAKPLLLFEVGFQLSYASVIGIVVFMPSLSKLIPLPKGNTPPTKFLWRNLSRIRDLFLVSLVTQLCTAPLLLFYFHQFPPYFLIANMAIIPFATVLIASVLLLLLFSWWPWLFLVIGKFVSTELAAIEWITSSVADLPHALIGNIYFDQLLLCLSIAFVVTIGWFIIGQKRWPALISSLILMLVIAIHLRIVEQRCATQNHFDVYHVDRHTAIEFFTGHQSYLICDSATAKEPQRIDYQTENNRIYRQCRNRIILNLDSSYQDSNIFLSNRFLSLEGQTFRIIDRSNYRERSNTNIQLDYLLLRQNPYISLSELTQQYHFDTLIIASDNSPYHVQKWITQSDSLGLPYRL